MVLINSCGVIFLNNLHCLRIRINHYMIPETGPTKNVDIFLLHVIYVHDEVYVLLVESVVS